MNFRNFEGYRWRQTLVKTILKQKKNVIKNSLTPLMHPSCTKLWLIMGVIKVPVRRGRWSCTSMSSGRRNPEGTLSARFHRVHTFFPHTIVMVYVLYKIPVQPETLKVVRWLHAKGVCAQPAQIVGRSYLEWVTDLPSIEVIESGKQYVGLRSCLSFYQELSHCAFDLESIPEVPGAWDSQGSA
jgi:hypothetical protein